MLGLHSLGFKAWYVCTLVWRRMVVGGGLGEVDDRRRPTVCKYTVGKYGSKRKGTVCVVLRMNKD